MRDKTVERIYSNSPKIIYPVIDIILGVYHKYPLCCVASFTRKTITNSHSPAESNYSLFGKRIACKFHRKKLEAKIVKSPIDLDFFYD